MGMLNLLLKEFKRKTYSFIWPFLSKFDKKIVFVICNELHYELIRNIIINMDNYSIYPATPQAKKFLQTKKIPFRKWIYFPRLIVCQDFLEANKSYYPFFSYALKFLLTESKCKKIQTFHGVLDKGWTYEKKFNDKYDLLLVPGKYAQERLIKNGLSTNKIRITGYSKFSKPVLKIRKQKTNKSKKTILYAPTYGVISSIPHLLKQVLELNKKYTVLFKPHYYDLYNRYVLFLEKKGVNIIRHNTIEEFFSVADIMISDSSSITFEFLVTKKPVVVLDSLLWIFGDETLNAQLGPEILLRDAFYRAKNPSVLTKLVKDLIENKQSHHKADKANEIFNYIFADVANPGKKAASFIVDFHKGLK